VYQRWCGRSDGGDAGVAMAGSIRATNKVCPGVAWIGGQLSAVGAVLRLQSGEVAMGGVIVCVRCEYLFS
jgi:hypothetical protein